MYMHQHICICTSSVGTSIHTCICIYGEISQEGQVPDEKTYSTLLRGATRAADSESILLLLWEALAQEADGSGRGKLLEKEVLQTAAQSLWRQQAMPQALLERLKKAGYEVKRQARKH